MDTLLEELRSGFPDAAHLIRVPVRLCMAAVLGAVIGIERWQERKPAGIRTHMLVAIGAALFTVVPLETGMLLSDLSRVIQGLTAGVGFLGAGVIMQMRHEHRVEGLTTAAGIWMTAAVGMSVGAGRPWPALVTVVLAVIVLAGLHLLGYRQQDDQPPHPPGGPLSDQEPPPER
jgi:putative Mg2+ transporter-C (MgtC) family protein